MTDACKWAAFESVATGPELPSSRLESWTAEQKACVKRTRQAWPYCPQGYTVEFIGRYRIGDGMEAGFLCRKCYLKQIETAQLAESVVQPWRQIPGPLFTQDNGTSLQPGLGGQARTFPPLKRP